jgi:hypothetical protein
MAQPLPIEDTKLGAQALAYVIELYRELTAENGAPTLGNQNQAVDFIRADPDLRRAVAAWAETVEIGEATTARFYKCPEAMTPRLRHGPNQAFRGFRSRRRAILALGSFSSQ